MIIAEFVKVMQKFRNIANHVYPEHWNFICKLRDIDTNEAQELYSVYKQAMNGRLPYNSKEQKVNDELLATVFALANDAYDYYETGPAQRFPNINLVGFGEYGKFVKVFWRNESGVLCSEEGNIMNSNIYQTVAYLLHKGLEIVAIVPEVDSINPSNKYVGDDKPTKNEYLKVYHGDVFCAWDNPERFWSHPEDNGLYLAVQEQGYKSCYILLARDGCARTNPTSTRMLR